MLGRRAACVLVGAFAAFAMAVPVSVAAAAPPKPKRVMIVVLDQMLPEYVERFNMDNVRLLMDGGANFEQAYLGHMAAETVISHNVMTSGVLPKRMGWSNEVYRDTRNILGAGAGAYHVTSSLGCEDFRSLIEARGYRKLDDYLRGKFITVGQKLTAACTAGQPADAEDIVVHMGSRKFDCDGDATINWRGPAGANVPAYLSEPACGRFHVDSSKTLTYGTAETPPAWMYPLDGNRFAVGNDEAHLGGDEWTADAAIEMMRHERDWKGMLVSFGSIDKAGHMWGADDRGPSGKGADVHRQAHVPYMARVADRQVGRLMAALKARGVHDETLVVLTADHAGQTARRYHGVNKPGQSDFNWYYGKDPDESYLDPSPSLKPLIATGNVDFSYQDAHVATWLRDRSPAALVQAARAVRRMPSVIAAYRRAGGHYERVGGTGKMTRRERVWWRAHGQELVDTMAAPYGPDVVGLLRDETSYGVKGDHGGHQRRIQEIPMAFSWPGLRPTVRQRSIRSVDILPTVLKAMGIRQASSQRLDGRAATLGLRKPRRLGLRKPPPCVPESSSVRASERLAHASC